MKRTQRLLGFAIALTTVLLSGHNPASAALDLYSGIQAPVPETQISYTDDNDLACLAPWSTADRTVY
jgi:hypothetical protein